jgi:diguanylate cyclase (GGDEF)-like protein
MSNLLEQTGLYASLFDVTRIVDPREGKLLAVENGVIRETNITCVNSFGLQDRCKNCTSIRAFYANEQIVKLEYLQDSVFLLMSAPLRIGERDVVVELIKNITNSMTVDMQDEQRTDEMASLIDRFNRMATVDHLTRLMNRRFIDAELPKFLRRSRRLREPISVVMADIDFFKNVNDTYSHQMGDFVLTEVAKILMSFVRRNSDFVARYGGEEFLICFPGVALTMCHVICERIRQSIEDHIFERNGVRLRLTISIGIAESGELEDLSQESIIALADKRLYEAKNSGRNRVVSGDDVDATCAEATLCSNP